MQRKAPEGAAVEGALFWECIEAGKGIQILLHFYPIQKIFYFNFIIVLIVEAADGFTAQPAGVLVCEELIEWCGPEIRAQPPFA